MARFTSCTDSISRSPYLRRVCLGSVSRPNRPCRQEHFLIGSLLIILVLLVGIPLSGCGGSSSKPISVIATPSSAMLDGGNSTTITASVTNDRNGAGVNWALSGPGALSNQSKSSVTYTAPAPPANSALATVTASSAADPTKVAQVSITIPPRPSITNTSLAAGNVGSAYAEQLNAAGGIPPYTWTISSGALPSCISMSSSGALSSSSGLMASCAGKIDLGFKVTDSGKPTALTATTTLSLVVNAAPAITFTGTMPSNATRGAAYVGSATASGGAGALTYSIQSGTLPPGLKLHTPTGVVTGLPAEKGNFDFTVKAADAYGDSETYPCHINVMDPLTLNDANLSTVATIHVAFSGTIVASGGSGNYSWQITGLPNSGLESSASGNILTVRGTPNALASLNFSVKLTDTGTQTVLTQPYTIEIDNPTPVALSATNPPAATVNRPYTAVIIATGGVGPHSWSINGSAVTAAGLALSNSLSASNAGSNKLSISGTPTTTDAVALNNVRVVDSVNTSAMQTYTVTVNGQGSQVTGKIHIGSYCGSTPPLLPPVTVTINTTPPMQTISDPDGNFTFEDVPDGTFTVTPSIDGPPIGPNSVFNPASAQITVNNGPAGALSFRVMLGYTISGSVAYHGALTGQTYINLVGECGAGIGTSISQDALASGGAFTLHGVPPGEYWVVAAMDPSSLGNGAGNMADPLGFLSSQIEVSMTNVAGISITMDDPYAETYSPPLLKSVSPTNSGVVISYDGSSVLDWWYTGWEAWSSYTIQWSTDKAFTGTPSSATFKAVGTGYTAWILNNGNDGMNGTLTPGTAYYFRFRGTNAAGNSDWGYWGDANSACLQSTCAVAVKIGQLAGSAYATVTGAVNITSEMAPIVTGPLYVGYFDPNTGAAYGSVISNPIIGENPYSISVLKSPTTGYIPFGILDQNKDGLVDVGDVTNLAGNPPPTIINSDTTGLIDLSYLYDRTRVQTHYTRSTSYENGTPITNSRYSLKFLDLPDKKLPVAVQVTAGPNIVVPMDIGNCGDQFDCGSAKFSNEVFLAGATPALGDIYTFHVTFSDGTSWDEYAQVTAFSGTTSIAGPDSVPTNLAPSGNVPGQIRPTFSWAYPTFPNQTASPTLYQFSVCCSYGDIWRIPGYGSMLDGFTATQIPGSLTWGIDPTDSTNKPNPLVLTTGTTYTWQIQAQDDLGNVAATRTTFVP